MEAPDVRTLINQFSATSNDSGDKRSEFSGKIAELLAQGDITLLQFIQQLGSQLTSDDDATRADALHCLSDTLASLNGRKLSRQDLLVLLDFFLTKLDDKHCMVYILQGLQSLIVFKSFSPSANDNMMKILNCLVESYDPSKFLAKVRYEAFALLEKLLDSFLDTIVTKKEYHDAFVKAFVNVSTGEKDPRNLLASFTLNRKINAHFSFDITIDSEKEFVNELFDNCFCYFPISFTPPANDPYKITAEQLKAELRLSLTSQDLFAKDLFHSLFEKLTSTNPLVRNDVLATLLLAVQTFQTETILEYWEYLWNGLKYEILHNENLKVFKSNSDHIIPPDFSDIGDDDEAKAIYLTLETLNEMTGKLQDHDVFLAFILDDLEDHMTSKNKFFNQCIILLSTIASNSVTAFNRVYGHLLKYDYLGKFIDVEKDEKQVSPDDDLSLPVAKQRDLIDNFGFIFISYQILSRGLPDGSDFFANNELLKVKDNLVVFLGQLLQASSNLEKTLKCKIIQQYVKLIQLKSFLSKEEKLLVLGILNDMFLEIIRAKQEVADDLVSNEILTGIVSLLNLRNDQLNKLVIENFLPSLLNEIYPENPGLNQMVEIFERIIVNYELLEILSIRLINKLTKNAEFNSKIIALIIKLILKNEHEQQFLMNSWYKNFLPSLFKNLTEDHRSIEVTGELIGLIVKYNDASKHQAILDQFIEIFYFNESGLNLRGYELIHGEALYVIILNKIISNIDKRCTLESVLKTHGMDIYGLADSLIELISKISDNLLRISYLQHLSLVVNKFFGTGESDKAYLESKLAVLNDPMNLQAFEVYIWLIKGLMLTLDPVGLKAFKESLQYLKDPETITIYLKSVQILLKDLKIFESSKELKKGDKLVSKVNNLNVRLLFKQQMFNIILNEILANHEADSSVYLNLLSILLSNVNESITKTRINEIIPLIIESLKLASSSLLSSSLKTLVVITDTNNMLNYLPFLIKTLASFATGESKSSSDEEIRYLSLKCLGNLIDINAKETILPYKVDLLNQLAAGLDDKRRIIRKLTCDIRQVLYEMR